MNSITNTKTRKAKNNAIIALARMANPNKRTIGKDTGLKRKVVERCEISGSRSGDTNIAGIEAYPDSNNRKRWKTLNEREVLECYFELDQEWTMCTIMYVKRLVHLSVKQIYKWGYEKRRRLNLRTSHDKIIDIKYVSKAEDLHESIIGKDFNTIVDGLFYDEENEEEVTLSADQKEMYDYVRNQLIKRSFQYEQQSDLDKLLSERIPIRNIAIEAREYLQSSLNKDISTGKIKNVKDLVGNNAFICEPLVEL
jgi:hypothetical protein